MFDVLQLQDSAENRIAQMLNRSSSSGNMQVLGLYILVNNSNHVYIVFGIYLLLAE